jgi:anion-transporting  ArsA/GET3 family ATPase
MTQLYFTCGTGGVGKTTTSAALAIAFAKQGYKTIVLTIDPARRLANSLHLPIDFNTRCRVPISDGQLDAMMLDAGIIFEQFAKRHSTPKEFHRLKENHYYQFARDKMGGIQEYMAVLQMMELFDSKSYDVIIIDTPPARNAIQFLKAPNRIQRLLSGSALRWFTTKDSGFLSFSLGNSLISKGLKRLLGEETITDISEFFRLFSKVAEKLEDSATKCTAIMSQSCTHFWLITVPQLSNTTETKAFIEYITEQQFNFDGIICNKMPIALEPLTEAQKLYLQKFQNLQESISWINERSQKEFEVATKNIQSLKNTNSKPKISIPKMRNLDKLEDLENLSNYLNQVVSQPNS